MRGSGLASKSGNGAKIERGGTGRGSRLFIARHVGMRCLELRALSALCS
jgi:hypothetical protein